MLHGLFPYLPLSFLFVCLNGFVFVIGLAWFVLVFSYELWNKGEKITKHCEYKMLYFYITSLLFIIKIHGK